MAGESFLNTSGLYFRASQLFVSKSRMLRHS